MTNKTFKNLSTLSAQLFLGTALVAGSAHGAAISVTNADETLAVGRLRQGIADWNNLVSGTSATDRTINLATGISPVLNANNTPTESFSTANSNNTVIFTVTDATQTITTTANGTGQKGFSGANINLVKSGANRLVLKAGDNTANSKHTYTGSTTVEGTGSLALQGTGGALSDMLVTTTNLIVKDTASFVLDASVGTVAQTFADVNVGATATFATVAGNTATLILTTGDFQGKIVQGGAQALSITKSQSADTANNTLKLANANNFTGTLTHNGGTIIASHKDALGASTAAITFAGNTTDEKILKTTVDQTAKGIAAITMPNDDKVVFDLEGDLTTTGDLATGGAAASFIKKGSKKLSVGRDNAATNYNGTAYVQAGILQVNGGSTSVLNNMKVVVTEDATFQGSGSFSEVTNAGKVQPGTGAAGTTGVTLTLASLDNTSTQSTIEIDASSSTVFNKLAVTGAFKQTKSGKYDFSLADGIEIPTDGLSLTGAITVGSFQDSAGTTVPMTDVTTANAFLANESKRARVLNAQHLLSNVELSVPSTYTSGTAIAVTAKITDLSNNLDARFDDKELAESFLRDYIVATLKDSVKKDHFDGNVAATTSTTGHDHASNAKASDKVRLAVANLMLLGKIDKAAASKILAQYSGVANRSAMESTASAMNTVAGAVSSHVASALGGASPYTAAPAAFSAGFRNTDGAFAKLAADSGLSSGCALDESLDNGAWVKGFGGWENLSNDGSSHPGNRTTVAGAAFGFDHYFTRDLLAGIAISYARINTTVNDSLGDSKADSYSATIYGGARFDDLTVDGAVMLASNHYDMTRAVPVQNVGAQTTAAERAKASPKSLDVGVHLGAGYLIRTQSVDVTPFASVDYRNASFDAYTETGLAGINSTFHLHADKARLQTWTPKVGVALSKAMVMAGGNWTPTLSVGWKAFVPMGDNTVDTKIVGMMDSFQSKHVVKTRHMGFAGLGVELDMRSGWHVNFGYEGAYNNKLNTHEFMVKVGKRF